MEKFLNISNHQLTDDQLKDIVDNGWELVELPDHLKAKWGSLNPFNYEDVCDEIDNFMIINRIGKALLAGYQPAVTFMVLKNSNRDDLVKYDLYYAHSERESVEEAQPDGSVIKRVVFRHKGFFTYN